MSDQAKFFGDLGAMIHNGGAKEREQAAAMEKVLSHQIAGYPLHFEAYGEDGADGYSIETENRWTGDWVKGRGTGIREACLELVKLLEKP